MRRRNLKKIYNRINKIRGKNANKNDARLIGEMFQENKKLFNFLEKRYGSLELVQNNSCLCHAIRKRLTPSFRQRAEKRVPILVQHAKNGEKYLYIQCNRHRGNDASLLDKGFKFLKDFNCWTNNPNL